MATRLSAANVKNLDPLVSFTQFNIEELEIYIKVMQGPYAAEWAKTMKKKLDQFHKNET